MPNKKNVFGDEMDKSEFDELFSKYLADVVQQCENHEDGYWISTADLRRFPFYQTIKKLSPKTKVEFLEHLGSLICSKQDKLSIYMRKVLSAKRAFPTAYMILFAGLMRTRLDLSPKNIVHFFDIYRNSHGFNLVSSEIAYWPISATIDQLEKTLRTTILTHSQYLQLSNISEWYPFANQCDAYNLPMRYQRAKLNLLLVLEIDGKKRVPKYSYLSGDAFGVDIEKQLARMTQNTQDQWAVYFHHICQSVGARPTDSFLVEASQNISTIGLVPFKRFLASCLKSASNLPIIETPRKHPSTVNNRHFLTPANQDLLTGLIWSIPQPLDQETKFVLAKVKENASQSVMYDGKIAPKVVKACNYAISLSA